MRDLHKAPFSLFWYWINERHRIYMNRQKGQAKPWTIDPILQEYKFTNAFRQLDKGTVWLVEHFVKPASSGMLDLLVFNIAWYRLFNWTGTGERFGYLTAYDRRRVRWILSEMEANDEQIFTNAHMTHGEAGRAKTETMLDAMDTLWKDRKMLAAEMQRWNTLEHAFGLLTKVRSIGPFIGYEIVTDLRHTPILDHATDINTWANAGPGAKRGLRRLYGYPLPEQPLTLMRNLLDLAWHGTHNLGSHVPTLELRDIEHSLCEFDKYCRVKYGEGKPRMKYPGKAGQ